MRTRPNAARGHVAAASLRGAAGAMLLLAAFGAAQAHELWVQGPAGPQATGAPVELRIAAGHAYPAVSAQATRDMAAPTVRVRDPAGRERTLDVEVRDAVHAATLVPEAAGPYLVLVEGEAHDTAAGAYAARCVVAVGAPPLPPAAWVTGRGLELVPDRSLADVRVGETVSFAAHVDGRPVPALVQILPEKGSLAMLRASPRRPATYALRHAGGTLVTAAIAGRRASLTFHVAE